MKWNFSLACQHRARHIARTMSQTKDPHSRKKKLCSLLRSAGSCFIDQTGGDTPADQKESHTLRNELDCLVTVYESGVIDPVQILSDYAHSCAPAPSDPASDPAPLTGTAQRRAS